MTRHMSLDDTKGLHLVGDHPIRALFFVEGLSNLGFLLYVYLYPSSFLVFLFSSRQEITPLVTHLVYWWASMVFVLTCLMFSAVPSRYNTPTLTAGLVHVRRFLYWCLLGSEIFLALLLISTEQRTLVSIICAIFVLLVAVGRLFVLFAKGNWFGTVLIEASNGKDKSQ